MSKRARVMIVLLVIVLCALISFGSWKAYQSFGRTPGELMDYSEKRLQGHPRVETVALPVIRWIRDWLNEPSLAERRQQLFLVPRPPVPVSAADVGTLRLPQADEMTTRIIRVGPAEAVRSIAAAARQARDGDVVEIQAGEYRGDVASWHQKRLTIRGVGGRARIFADGDSAEGKAIWVIRNGDFKVSNIEFIGARVEDRNGAGIRFENGFLRIDHCLFWGNENGILASGAPSTMEISNSEFGYNGSGDGLSHNIYAGLIRSLSVTSSYFHHANIGHLLKSRAAINKITYNRFTDEDGGRASYELDFPNGGMVYLVGNLIQQNRQTENSIMVTFGEESLLHAANKMSLISNTIVNDHPYGGTFLRVSPGAERTTMANNLFIGSGRLPAAADLESINNVHAGWEVFVRASRHDYRLSSPGPKLAYQPIAKGEKPEVEVNPTSVYVHPATTKRLVGQPAYVGALPAAN